MPKLSAGMKPTTTDELFKRSLKLKSRMLGLKKKNKDKGPSAFDGLTEKEVSALYRLANIRSLKENETLIQEGEIDQTVYVLLEGEIKIVKCLGGQPKRIATLPRGSWVGEIAFTKSIPRTASAIASKPCKVMAIDKNIINALEEKTQLFFYKRLNYLSSARIKQLEGMASSLSGKNRSLEKYIYSTRTGDSDDYSRSGMIRGIIDKIPKLPFFASNLAFKLQDEAITAEEVVKLMDQDPSLVATVLKRINSSYYGLEKKVGDIQHAIVLLGYNELYHLVFSEGIRRTMPVTLPFRKLLNHSVAISHIAFNVCLKSRAGKPVQMATIGLLHDLGQSVIQLLKDQYTGLSLLIDSLDRAKLGALLLKEWNLPNVIWECVEFQFYPEFSPPDNIPEEVQKNVAVLYLSHLYYDILQGKTEDELPVAFLDDYKELLNWGRLSFNEILQIHLLPEMLKKINSFPASLRMLLQKYQQSRLY